MSVAVVLGLLGLGAGLLTVRWLRTGSYRYADERHLPVRRPWWLPPVLAAAAAALGLRLHDEPVVLATYAVALGWMAVLAAIDLDVRRLPDRWTLPAWLATPAALAACAVTTGDWSAWLVALACGLGNGVVYLLLAVINPAGLGLGDVKAAVPLGMLTGWFGWPAALAAFVLAFLLGLFVGVVVALRSGEGRKATFPFGPSMLGAAFLVVLAAA